jgi:hypothetical protein
MITSFDGVSVTRRWFPERLAGDFRVGDKGYWALLLHREVIFQTK